MDAKRLEQFRKIDGGGFAFSGGVRSDNDFFDRARLQAFDKGLDSKLLRAAARKGRKRAAEDVIHAAVGARFLDGHDVVRLFDDADQLLVAMGAGAVEAGISVGDIAADGAFADFFFGVANGVGEAEGVLGRGAQEKKGETLGGFLTDPGRCFSSSMRRSTGAAKSGIDDV